MSVCFQCLERAPGCHDKCGRYQEEAKKRKTAKEEIRKGREAWDFLFDSAARTKKKYHRGGK